MTEELLTTLTKEATKNIRDMVGIALEHKEQTPALVVYDKNYGLTDILVAGYKEVLPHARFVNFDETSREDIIASFDEMNEGELVVLVQSSNFLLNAFRIRLHLFNRKLKVIEHMHLNRNKEDVWDVYINSLAYDPSWYRVIGKALKEKLVGVQTLIVKGGDAELTFTGGLEVAKLNVGDYTGMENIGGTFPIGEVFTEALTLTNTSGDFLVYAFADHNFDVSMNAPFKVHVENGLVVSWDETAPKVFGEIIEMVKEIERPIIREIGFGLNRAITKERFLEDITAFERILGLHLSLGEKHGTYKKEGINVQKSRFHIDLFPVADEIIADGVVIFKDGAYLV